MAMRISFKSGLVLPWMYLVLVLGACGEDGGVPWGEGKDGVPPLTEDNLEIDTFWIGRLGVGELNQITGQDSGHTTLVQAFFSDFTYYGVILADKRFFPGSEACFIYTSRQTKVKYCRTEGVCTSEDDCSEGEACLEGACLPAWATCQLEEDCPGIQVCDRGLCRSPECPDEQCPGGYACLEGQAFDLGMEAVTFGGLVGGDLVLEPDQHTQVLPGRAFEQTAVSIRVESENGERDFPAFQDEVPAPAAPVLTRLGEVYDPDLSSTPSIGITTQRTDSFVVEWEAGDGDYFEFKILPGAGSNTPFMKLRCITYDDGGIEIPAAALQDLALDLATNFQVKAERHNFQVHLIQEGGQTQAAALMDMNAAVEGTVVR